MHLDKGVTRTDATKGILDDEKVELSSRESMFQPSASHYNTCISCDDIDNYYDNVVAADGGDDDNKRIIMMTEASINFNGSHNDLIVEHMT